MRTVLTDEAATMTLGQCLAKCVHAPALVWLRGDLGTGKTTLARAWIQSLGYRGLVKSPTYTLVESYVLADVDVHHFDLYRFADPQEWFDAGLAEYIGAALCLIEWPERGEPYLPRADLEVHLHPLPIGREAQLHAGSPYGTDCLRCLRDAL